MREKKNNIKLQEIKCRVNGNLITNDEFIVLTLVLLVYIRVSLYE
jgi:hypothetical protein